MMKIDYRLNTRKQINNKKLSNIQLRYHCFLGDIVFGNETCDLSTAWGWVPVWDFMLAISYISKTLPYTTSQKFEFTESNSVIYFQYKNGNVKISSNYHNCSFSVPHRELVSNTIEVTKELALDIEGFFPRIARTEEFIALFCK